MLVVNQKSRVGARRGAVAVLMALSLVVLCGVAVLVVDVGYVRLVGAQLQNSADAAAVAGARSLYPELGNEIHVYAVANRDAVRSEAQKFTRLNRANGKAVEVNLNSSNDSAGDIVIGRLNNPSNQSETLTATYVNPNTVLVHIPMGEGHLNGPVPLFFAKIFGWTSISSSASAMATADYPTFAPFVVSEAKWNTLASGGNGDSYKYNDPNVTAGADGIPEIIVQPGNWNGNGLPPGNFGWVQIGPNQGANVLRSQIDMGPSESDLNYNGGSLAAPGQLSGKPGLVASVQKAITGGSADGRQYAGVIGQVKRIALYSSATGNGNAATFTITKFVSARIMAADLNGNPYIVFQLVTDAEKPAPVRITR